MENEQRNLELYKTYVATITSAEQRRQKASGVYLSLLSAAAAILGLAKNIDAIFIVSPILVISYIWLASIHNFRNLARAKFKVIEKFEADWSIRPFEFEWQEFKKINQRKLSLTHLEMVPPILIIIGSLAYLAFRLFKCVCLIS